MMKLALSQDLDYKLFVLLRQAGHVILKLSEKELRKNGISLVEHAVLFITQSIGHKATPAEIARWMVRERHTISALLMRMEKKGLIRMTKDLDRKNLLRVSLTKKGKQAYDISTRMDSVRSIISSLPEEVRIRMISYLKELRDNGMEELGLNYKPPFP
jgi:DNA-binding MarR family transcriptional regulator